MSEQQENPQQNQQRFEIQRLYTKDLSFESPNSPQLFLREWQPEVNIDLNVEHSKIEDDIYEVALKITVTAKAEDKTAFLVEVQQAGIFTVGGFEQDQLNHMLGSLCPGILYPYARETVSDLVNRGSFPQLLLSPVNFDAFYQQKMTGGEKPN